uniref:Uncharacterized protein n=1 Tax=uncultured Rhodospirillales bacterium HF0200_01O14 TaxID=710787 RepID=E0XTU4_9PROT|nr:hypothetical protein [uncultured Rhodospirillales bacterium HF0200_01O14]
MGCVNHCSFLARHCDALGIRTGPTPRPTAVLSPIHSLRWVPVFPHC